MDLYDEMDCRAANNFCWTVLFNTFSLTGDPSMHQLSAILLILRQQVEATGMHENSHLYYPMAK
jgi:hypothetical protein